MAQTVSQRNTDQPEGNDTRHHGKERIPGSTHRAVEDPQRAVNSQKTPENQEIFVTDGNHVGIVCKSTHHLFSEEIHGDEYGTAKQQIKC